MKYLRLIAINALRSRRRTILTVLGVAVALFLFSTLRTVITSFDAALEVTDASRLIVRNATSIIFSMPQAYREKIASVDGVVDVSFGDWFGGIYIDERNFFPQFAVEAESYFRMYPEMVVDPTDMASFMRERNACVVGTGLARRYGWKVGDAVRLRGTIYPGDWDFVVRGIYQPSTPDFDETMFFFHYASLEENSYVNGQVGHCVVRIDDHTRAGEVSAAIDRRFTNSASETMTETEEAFQLGFFAMLGNIELLLNAIGGAVIFTIILVTMNTMMMAGRERIREVAVLKTLGFTNGRIVFITLGEAALIALIGGAIGCGAARVIYAATHFTMGGFVPSFIVRTPTIVAGMAIALLLGLLSGLVPAVSAARLRITDALRHTG